LQNNYKLQIMKKFFEPWFNYSGKEKIQTIGGFLLVMYAPILICFIWFDTELMLKILLTNSVLVGAIWLFDKSC
jgi:hypothetical protein